MRSFAVTACSALKGRLYLPGDKSIAHRAIILAALSKGTTIIRNFPANGDCLSTVSILRKLGVKIILKGSQAIVFGRGLRGLKKPAGTLCIRESGTTFRLLLGVLCAQEFSTVLSAGRMLSRRPMSRVLIPLRMMGARVAGKKRAGREEYPPVFIDGGRGLTGIRYTLPVASAQVKSAILLAGLFACSGTEVIEPVHTRDHTERMLSLFGAPVLVRKNRVILKENSVLVSPGTIHIPGDISSAAFFMVAASVLPGSSVVIRSVSINPLRRQVIDILKKMGARIKVTSVKRSAYASEPCADVAVSSASLRPVRIEKSQVPGIIDELPVLMVAACFAKGTSVFKGVAELRVKETDRIRSMMTNLNRMGARVTLRKDAAGSECIVIEGPVSLRGAGVSSYGDHRTAMSMVVAGLAACGRTTIDDVSCIAKSFPGFLSELRTLFK